ncbi:O-methyltransferase [Streptococcus pneumoniae]|nr:O-methyltransferase [Streptococcus pneumoniae]
MVVLDDIFQGGDVAKDIMEVRRGQRTIYRGLQKLFYATLDNPELTATLVPLGDGILMLRKNVADVQLSESE